MPIGRIFALAAASAAALFVAGAANAQVPRGFTPQGADQQRLENNTSLSAKRYQDGVDALQARNFVVAEGIFEDFLRGNPNHPDAKAPDPKSRLGVTLAKLGDVNGAMEQRAALEKMDKDCKGKCRNAQWIANGIAMIDAALPPKT
jgi:TolA-binding protein